MIRRLICAVLFACLAGCAGSQKVYIPIPTTVTVKKIPATPELPIYSLDEKSSPDTVIKAYVASVKLLNDYSNSLLTFLKRS